MFSALGWFCWRFLAEKGTQDSMSPNKFPAFWVMYASCVAVLCCFCALYWLLNNFSLHCIYQAWKLWSEKKLLDIMDPSLGETCNENQFFKCAVVGLLCIQDEPSDRPTMSNVLYMLDIETTSMPIPTQPTFFMNKRYSGSASSSSKPETSLKFDSSYEQGR